jgi:hypothetical protein
MAKIVKQIVLMINVALLCGGTVIAVENSGRYFPFSSRPEKSWYKRGSTADVDFFYASGHNIANEDSAPLGLGEVAGSYDLRDIVFAMDQVGLPTTEVKQLIGNVYANSQLAFNVHGKVRIGGASLRYAWTLPSKTPITLGVVVPLVRVESTLRYSLDMQKFMQTYYTVNVPTNFQPFQLLDVKTQELYEERLDHARRVAHEAMGFSSNYWSNTGVGDIDFFARSNFVFDHRFLMRTVDIAVQYGVIIPSGMRRSLNDPASVSFMNDGHWSIYAQVSPTFELKEDLRLGFLFRGEHYLSNTRDRRISVFKESNLYSPLVGKTTVQPGTTFIFNTFLALGNVYDGLHLQGRYTYKSHLADRWQDVRLNQTVQSYLTRTPTSGVAGQADVTDKDIKDAISAKEYLSKFRSHYITIQLTYDPLEARQELALKPKFFASFDSPFFDASRGIMQANQVSVGVELHF